MTQTEAIRTIAEYDGWEFRNNGNTAELFKDGEFIRGCHGWQDCNYFDYATNIASLYFVAGRVVRELEQHKNVISGLARTEIKRTVLTFSPDLTPLLMAVADGVALLKTYNNG